jgi:hypothetical protein
LSIFGAGSADILILNRVALCGMIINRLYRL